jgi:hypothetical protein
MDIFRWIRTLKTRKTKPPRPSGSMRCDKCSGSIHRHDRYIILVARHKDCGDPRGVGQKVLKLGLEPEPSANERLNRGIELLEKFEQKHELDTKTNTTEAHDADTASEPAAAQEIGEAGKNGDCPTVRQGPDEATTGLL